MQGLKIVFFEPYIISLDTGNSSIHPSMSGMYTWGIPWTPIQCNVNPHMYSISCYGCCHAYLESVEVSTGLFLPYTSGE